jgi:hypothetical protein
LKAFGSSPQRQELESGQSKSKMNSSIYELGEDCHNPFALADTLACFGSEVLAFDVERLVEFIQIDNGASMVFVGRAGAGNFGRSAIGRELQRGAVTGGGRGSIIGLLGSDPNGTKDKAQGKAERHLGSTKRVGFEFTR